MARTLAPIPLGTPIVDRDGTITPFFRQRWQDVGEGWSQSPSVQHVRQPAQTGALAAFSAWTVQVAGVYRVGWYLRTTRVDPVSSSATVSMTFVDLDGQALAYTDVALTYNLLFGWRSVVVPIRCQAPSDITLAVAYASNTPGAMRYDLEVTVEFLP